MTSSGLKQGLQAILAADVSGNSRLMAADERAKVAVAAVHDLRRVLEVP